MYRIYLVCWYLNDSFQTNNNNNKKRQNIFHISINNIQFAWYYYSDLCDSNLHRTFIQLFQSIFSFVLRIFFFRRIFVVRKKLHCFWIFLGIKIWKKNWKIWLNWPFKCKKCLMSTQRASNSCWHEDIRCCCYDVQ